MVAGLFGRKAIASGSVFAAVAQAGVKLVKSQTKVLDRLHAGFFHIDQGSVLMSHRIIHGALV
jgi:hypothetical protein